MLDRCDAALVIGDNALFQGGVAAGRGQGRSFEKIDVGEVWTSMTGLPFVWAFWAGRPTALQPDDVIALQQARDAGVGESERIAAEYFPASPERQRIGARYLRDNIKYSIGPDECTALDMFFGYAVEAGVVSERAPLRFFDR
jgi:predicted solute-binding protein